MERFLVMCSSMEHIGEFDRSFIVAYKRADARAKASQAVADDILGNTVSLMKSAGYSFRRIAKELGKPTTTIVRALAREGLDLDAQSREELFELETTLLEEYAAAHNSAWRDDPRVQMDPNTPIWTEESPGRWVRNKEAP